MIIETTDFKRPQEFGKTYKKKNGKTGVSRAYITQLIKEEIEKPGTTGLDVLVVDRNYFVRYTSKSMVWRTTPPIATIPTM